MLAGLIYKRNNTTLTSLILTESVAAHSYNVSRSRRLINIFEYSVQWHAEIQQQCDCHLGTQHTTIWVVLEGSALLSWSALQLVGLFHVDTTSNYILTGLSEWTQLMSRRMGEHDRQWIWSHCSMTHRYCWCEPDHSVWLRSHSSIRVGI